MKKLTKREKILIYILSCFLILTAGIYFILLPSYNRYAEVKNQYDEAKYTQTTMEAAIQSISALETAKAEGVVKITEKQGLFSDRLTNEGLDKVLTPLCLSFQLSPKRLSVVSNGYTGIEIFKAMMPAADGGMDDDMVAVLDELEDIAAIDSDETEASTSESEEAVNSEETMPTEPGEGIPVLVGVVELELKGTQRNFYRLMDTVASRPDLVIASFDLSPVAEQKSETIRSGTTTTEISYSNWIQPLRGGESAIRVTFNLFMIEKTEL